MDISAYACEYFWGLLQKSTQAYDIYIFYSLVKEPVELSIALRPV